MDIQKITNQIRESLRQEPQKKVLVPGNEYDHIVLTEQEINLAIYIYKKEKNAIIENKKYFEELKKEQEPLVLNVDSMKKYILNKAGFLQLKFSFNEYNQKIIDSLCKYFTNVEGELDLNKGIMLFGNVGCGKTTLMKLFNENQKSSFKINPCKKIADRALVNQSEMYSCLNEYSNTSSSAMIGKQFKNNESLGWCFDDLGTEDDLKLFGNSRNIMADLLLRCYDNYSMKSKIHITTNLSREQIKEFYGERVVSRMIEMFNMIEFPVETPDYRRGV